MRIVFVTLLLLMGIASCDGAYAADKIVRLSPGGTEMLELPENPSTGYKWQLDPAQGTNLSIVRLHDDGFAPDGTRIGAPGIHRWTIEALSTGSALIVLLYQRPWEHAPVRRYEISVEVTAR